MTELVDLVVWEHGTIEEPKGTGFDTLVVVTRRIVGTRRLKGGILYAYLPKVDESGRPIVEYRSFPFDNPSDENDRRRPVYGRTEAGDVVRLGTMYLAGRSDAGMRHGRRWGRCR